MFDLKILLFLVFAVIIYFLYNIIDKQQDMLKTLEDKVEAIKEENSILEKQIINTQNLTTNTYEQLTTLINLQNPSENTNIITNVEDGNDRLMDDVIVYSNEQPADIKGETIEETTENDDSEFDNLKMLKSSSESPEDINNEDQEEEENEPKIVELTENTESENTNNILEMTNMKMNEVKEIAKSLNIKLYKKTKLDLINEINKIKSK